MALNSLSEGTVVIDLGTEYTKAGFAGYDSPQVVIKTVNHRSVGSNFYISGSNAMQLAMCPLPEIHLYYPIQHTIITNFEDVEAILHHIIYDKLKIAAEDHTFLLTESPPGPKANRERLTQIMFETFNVPNFCIKVTLCLSLYASGRITGLSIESGCDTTWIGPIYEEYNLPHACLRLDYAGRNVTNTVYNSIINKCPFNVLNVGNVFIFELFNDIKEKCCYVSKDYVKELNSNAINSFNYTLPDGTNITIGQERFTCTESIFSGHQQPNLYQSVFNSIMKCDIDIRSDLYSNIVLGGGNTLFEGLQERLNSEVVNLAPFNSKVRVQKCKNPKYSVWVGGSILGSFEKFNKHCITRDDYNESGPSIVHRKCF